MTQSCDPSTDWIQAQADPGGFLLPVLPVRNLQASVKEFVSINYICIALYTCMYACIVCSRVTGYKCADQTAACGNHFSIHHVGPGNQRQVIRLGWQLPLPDEPSCQFMCTCKLSSQEAAAGIGEFRAIPGLQSGLRLTRTM